MKLQPHIDVIICTCKRPTLLRKCLGSLNGLNLAVTSRSRVRILVVDNDAAASAKQVVTDLYGAFSLRLDYIHEKTPGIPCARNAGLDNVRSIADFIGFVDDDEFVDPLWLDHLVTGLVKFKADVVSGPVIPAYTTTPPPWILDGKFLCKRSLKTGTEVQRATTSNILFTRRTVVCNRFDTAMAHTGGSDTMLTKCLWMKGYKIVWVEEAIVYEFIPPKRLQLTWILQRAFRNGQVDSYIRKRLHEKFECRQYTEVQIFSSLLKDGVKSLVKSRLIDKAKLVCSLQAFFMALGLFSRNLGFIYKEYQHLHKN